MVLRLEAHQLYRYSQCSAYSGTHGVPISVAEHRRVRELVDNLEGSKRRGSQSAAAVQVKAHIRKDTLQEKAPLALLL